MALANGETRDSGAIARRMRSAETAKLSECQNCAVGLRKSSITASHSLSAAARSSVEDGPQQTSPANDKPGCGERRSRRPASGRRAREQSFRECRGSRPCEAPTRRGAWEIFPVGGLTCGSELVVPSLRPTKLDRLVVLPAVLQPPGGPEPDQDGIERTGQDAGALGNVSARKLAVPGLDECVQHFQSLCANARFVSHRSITSHGPYVDYLYRWRPRFARRRAALIDSNG